MEDAQGCLDSAEVEINNLSVGTIDLNAEQRLSVYPNPSSGSVYLQLNDYSGELKIKLMDAQAKVISQEAHNSVSGAELQIDLSAQPAGIYFLEVSGVDLISTHKIQLLR